jgi:hypothetical protein
VNIVRVRNATSTGLGVAKAAIATQSLRTRALRGIGTIPGVEDATIVAEDDESVHIQYRWAGVRDFDRTDEHLAPFGVEKIWDLRP